MKALSLRQPWAHAVLHLGKRVENRDWAGSSFRGPVLLHASKMLVLRDFDEEIDSIINIVNPKPGNERLEMLKPLAYMSVPLRGKHHGEGTWRPAATLPLGGIVGRARIDGIINDSRDFAAYAAGVDGSQQQRAWWTGGFALVLANVEPLPFIPWKGSLGFFDVPSEVIVTALRERDEIDAKIRRVIAEHGMLEAKSRILFEAPEMVQRRFQELVDSGALESRTP